jgi:hypothetical protein
MLMPRLGFTGFSLRASKNFDWLIGFDLKSAVL